MNTVWVSWNGWLGGLQVLVKSIKRILFLSTFYSEEMKVAPFNSAKREWIMNKVILPIHWFMLSRHSDCPSHWWSNSHRMELRAKLQQKGQPYADLALNSLRDPQMALQFPRGYAKIQVIWKPSKRRGALRWNDHIWVTSGLRRALQWLWNGSNIGDVIAIVGPTTISDHYRRSRMFRSGTYLQMKTLIWMSQPFSALYDNPQAHIP
jgi:hypothetical protein